MKQNRTLVKWLAFIAVTLLAGTRASKMLKTLRQVEPSAGGVTPPPNAPRRTPGIMDALAATPGMKPSTADTLFGTGYQHRQPDRG